MKSTVISPIGRQSDQQFVSSGKCFGVIGEDNSRKIIVLPQPNGYLRMVGPLFIPLFPTTFSWNDKIDLLYFHVILQDYNRIEDVNQAAEEFFKKENWTVKIGDEAIHPTTIEAYEYNTKQSYLEIKFSFPEKVVDIYELKYIPEKINLKYRHKLKWVYRAFTIDPKLAPQCDL